MSRRCSTVLVPSRISSFSKNKKVCDLKDSAALLLNKIHNLLRFLSLGDGTMNKL